MNEKTLSITETRSPGLDLLSQVRIFGLPLPLYAFMFAVMLIAHMTDTIPDNIVGGFGFMFVVGALFGELGKRLPIFNKYIGGAPVMIFLVAAWFVHAGLLTQNEIDTVTAVMKKTDFLDLFIAVLITGSILAVNRKLLLKSLVGYIPTILAAVAGASILGILGGMMFGISIDKIMMLYVLPIMGGGNGAG
ncbi:2-hydroxycarboxylate transporter family protein, partial [Vibrio harveyi]